jgi:hypothetical protein
MSFSLDFFKFWAWHIRQMMKANYATPAKIRIAINAVRDAGIEVQAVEIATNGDIRVVVTPVQASVLDAFDSWKSTKAGKA